MEYNPPNTRERIAARRRKRQTRPVRSGSQVRPGLQRALGHWLGTGQLFSLGLFLVTMGVLVYLFTSPRFTVQEVTVAGNTILKSAAIIDLSALRGLPIWFVDDAAAVSRLHQSAYIERASVSVALPGRATITVIERRPEVYWQLGDMKYLVDSSGKVLDVVADIPDEERPSMVIVDTSAHVLKPNDQVDPDALKLAQALALRLPAELKMTPAVIGWDFALGVYVKTSTDQTIVFGRMENLDRKLAILGYLLADSTAFTYLDLRPANPFYQNRTAEPVTP